MFKRMLQDMGTASDYTDYKFEMLIATIQSTALPVEEKAEKIAEFENNTIKKELSAALMNCSIE